MTQSQTKTFKKKRPKPTLLINPTREPYMWRRRVIRLNRKGMEDGDVDPGGTEASAAPLGANMAGGCRSA
jgi:hypothetical protein